jgi:hypothetical protein
MTLIDELSAELANDETAQAERRKAAWREYAAILENPTDADKLRLRGLIRELGINTSTYVAHSDSFKALRQARAAAPTPEVLAKIVDARCAAEKAAADYRLEAKRRAQELEALRGSATAAEGQATAAIDNCRAMELKMRAVLPEAFDPPPARAQQPSGPIQIVGTEIYPPGDGVVPQAGSRPPIL